MSSIVVWYVARAAGLVSWALLTAAVTWGLALSTRSLRQWRKPAWVLDLHRFVGGLTVIFVGVHVVALLLDTYVHFGLVEVLVPLTSSWHPVATAWGVVGLYLLAAVELTSLLRRRLSVKVWRRVHFATLPLFVFATVHGFSAGTDRTNMAVIAAAVVGSLTAAALVARRVARTVSPPGGGGGNSTPAIARSAATDRPPTRVVAR